MWRRKFIAGLACTVAFPLAARAQTRNRIYRLGHLANSSDSEVFSRQITLPELARLGFVEGRNLVFDARVGDVDVVGSSPKVSKTVCRRAPHPTAAGKWPPIVGHSPTATSSSYSGFTCYPVGAMMRHAPAHPPPRSRSPPRNLAHLLRRRSCRNHRAGRRQSQRRLSGAGGNQDLPQCNETKTAGMKPFSGVHEAIVKPPGIRKRSLETTG
jgi:hypothetical protein